MTESSQISIRAMARSTSRVILSALMLQFAAWAVPAAAEGRAPGWSSSCTSKDRAAPLFCSMEQTLVASETGALIGKAEVRVTAKSEQPLLLLLVPLGVDVRAGLRLRVDDAELADVAVQTCNAGGCLAALPLVPSAIAALRGGRVMTMTFRGTGKPELTARFSLAGFSETFGKIE